MSLKILPQIVLRLASHQTQHKIWKIGTNLTPQNSEKAGISFSSFISSINNQWKTLSYINSC